MLKDIIKNIIKDMPVDEQLEFANAFREGFNLSEIFLNTPEHIDRVLEGMTPSEVIHLMRLGFYDRNDLFVTYDEWDDSLLSGDLFDIEDLDTMAREIIDNDLDLGCDAIRAALDLVSERDRLADILKTLPDEELLTLNNEERVDTRPCIYRMDEFNKEMSFKELTPTEIAKFTADGYFNPNDKFFICPNKNLHSSSNIADLVDMRAFAEALLDSGSERVKELLK